MSAEDGLVIIGLTGSIGMGKSTTAQMFANLGCPVFDADAAVHQLYDVGGKAVPLIRSVFPDAVKDGRVDRQRLGDHMRSDPLNLKVLESFIHPWVGTMRAEFLTKARAEKAKAVIFDIPLLFETGGDQHVDTTVVVTAAPETQAKRVLSRPNMTPALFEMILSKQMPDAEKRRRADFVISTDTGMEAARSEVARVLAQILRR